MAARSPLKNRAWEDLRKAVSCLLEAAVVPQAVSIHVHQAVTTHCTAVVPQARKLEGELDVKLASYAKLCSGFEATPGAATEQVLHLA